MESAFPECERGQDSDGWFRALIENAADGIAIVNFSGKMVYASPTARRMFGYALDVPADVIIPDESTHPDDLPAVLAMLGELMQQPGQTMVKQYRFRHRDGSWQWIESCFSNMREVPGVGAIVINFRNIDDRKRADAALAEANRELTALLRHAEELAVKAEAATRAKSEFLAVMSHELRTPLNGVLGFSEILVDELADPEHKSYAKKIHESGNHLLDVVNDILDFSSIERGNLAVASAPVALGELVGATCEPIRNLAAARGLDFRCELDPGLPAKITGDGRRIRQILTNLLGNAIKFTGEGSVVLRVAPAPGEEGKELDFFVQDTGPGIAPETLGMLFQPFTQADSTLCRKFQGTGLGLAISKRLAEAMGGKVTAISTEGLGSTFALRLPVEPPAAAAPAHPRALAETRA